LSVPLIGIGDAEAGVNDPSVLVHVTLLERVAVSVAFEKSVPSTVTVQPEA
jgi:hypothetical protein